MRFVSQVQTSHHLLLRLAPRVPGLTVLAVLNASASCPLNDTFLKEAEAEPVDRAASLLHPHHQRALAACD
jgi:hypothetical protein